MADPQINIKLNLKDIEKLKKATRSIDNLVDGFGEVEKAQERVSVQQSKFGRAGTEVFKGLKQGLSSFIGLFGKLTITASVAGAVFVALEGVVKLFKTLFRFNVGGIATQFARVRASISVGLNKALLDLVRLFKSLDPIIKPLIKSIADGIISVVRITSRLFEGFTKSNKTLGTMSKFVELAKERFLTLWNIIKQFFSGIAEGFSGAQGDGLDFFESLSLITQSLLKIQNVILKVVEQLKIFKVLGTILGVVFRVVFEVIKGIANLINDIVQGITAVVRFLQGDLTGAAEALKATTIAGGNVGAQTQNNITNNVSVVGSGPINQDNAPRIGDIVSQQLQTAGRVA